MGRLFLLAVFVGFCSSLNAQVKNRLGIILGPQVSIPHYEFNPVTTYDLGLRFTAGVFYDVSIGDYFSIVTEVAYSGLGTRERFNFLIDVEEPNRYTYVQNLNYLQLPVTLKARTGGYGIQGWVEGGGYIAVLLTANGRILGGDGLFQGLPVNTIEGFRQFDFGLRAGLGVDITPVPEHTFTLGMRFLQGFHDVNAEEGLRNRAISLTAGYIYKL
jgi:hypothetical protein